MSNARALVEKWYRAFDVERSAAACAALTAPDCELVAPGAQLKGPAQIEAYLQAFLDACGDLHHQPQSWVDAGDTCVVELVAPGTHTGPLQTPKGVMAPTGRRMEIHAANVFRVSAGRFSSIRFYFDQVQMETQLGLPRGTLVP